MLGTLALHPQKLGLQRGQVQGMGEIGEKLGGETRGGGWGDTTQGSLELSFKDRPGSFD